MERGRKKWGEAGHRQLENKPRIKVRVKHNAERRALREYTHARLPMHMTETLLLGWDIHKYVCVKRSNSVPAFEAEQGQGAGGANITLCV